MNVYGILINDRDKVGRELGRRSEGVGSSIVWLVPIGRAIRDRLYRTLAQALSDGVPASWQ